MKMLFIIRHGKAAARGDYLSDADRPLTDEGIEEMQAVGRALARLTDISVVLTSPLVRARQTAEQVVAGFDPAPKLIVLDQLGSVSSFRRLAEAINRDRATDMLRVVVRLYPKRVLLELKASRGGAELELWSLRREVDYFREVFGRELFPALA